MDYSNINGYGGYTTMVNSSHIVNGLEPADEDVLPREVFVQIANYEASKQQDAKARKRKR